MVIFSILGSIVWIVWLAKGGYQCFFNCLLSCMTSYRNTLHFSFIYVKYVTLRKISFSCHWDSLLICFVQLWYEDSCLVSFYLILPYFAIILRALLSSVGLKRRMGSGSRRVKVVVTRLSGQRKNLLGFIIWKKTIFNEYKDKEALYFPLGMTTSCPT